MSISAPSPGMPNHLAARASAVAVLTGLAALAGSGAVGSPDLPVASPPSAALPAAAPSAFAQAIARFVAGPATGSAAQPAATQLAAQPFGVQPFAAQLAAAQAATPPPAAPQPAVAPAFVPRVIMVIRHGEKPAKGHSLTARGWSRARVLPTLFALPDAGAPDRLPAPKVIFAASATDGGTGQRTRETVSSLSSRLNVPVNTAYGKGQEASLVRQATAQAANGPVLICWQHGEIPAIASALKVVGPRPPAYWPGSRFDMVWKFTETPQGWTFSEVPEKLLPGDRAG